MEQTHQCSETRRFDNLEKDIQELKIIQKESQSAITALKESQTETKVYMKQIFERIDDLKILFTQNINASNNGIKEVNSGWFKFGIELLKAVATIIGIVVGIQVVK